MKYFIQCYLFVEAEQIYQQKPNFKESMIQIYTSLAACALMKLWRNIDEVEQLIPTSDSTSAVIANNESLKYAQLVVSNLQLADTIDPAHPYSWLIKGFYELRQATDGDYSRADRHFNNIIQLTNGNSSNGINGASNSDKHYNYGAYVGLVSNVMYWVYFVCILYVFNGINLLITWNMSIGSNCLCTSEISCGCGVFREMYISLKCLYLHEGTASYKSNYT